MNIETIVGEVKHIKLEARRGETSQAELCKRHNLSEEQVSKWKQQFVETPDFRGCLPGAIASVHFAHKVGAALGVGDVRCGDVFSQCLLSVSYGWLSP